MLEPNGNKNNNWAYAVGAAVLGMAGLAYARRVEPGRLEVTHRRLALPRLDPEFHGYRLVHISDIHMDGWMTRRRLQEIVEIANAQQPDFVAITGDFVTHSPHRYAAGLIQALRGLETKDGAAAVLGNHDHWSDPDIVRRVIHESGLADLSNRSLTLQREQACLHLAGVDAYTVGCDRLEQVLQALPEQGAAILLAHEPDFADIAAASGRFDLQLSGHSHGGQVVLPIIGAPYLPEHAEKYPDGLYYVRDMLLYTNRGLGMVHLKLRLNCRPELTVFTLEAGQASDEADGRPAAEDLRKE